MDKPPAQNPIAPSRQKSCNACVKGKRYCDKLQAGCSRCKEKKIGCVYAKRLYSEAFPADFTFDTAQLGLPWAALDSPSSVNNFLDICDEGFSLDSNSDFINTMSSIAPAGQSNFLPTDTVSSAVNLQVIQ